MHHDDRRTGPPPPAALPSERLDWRKSSRSEAGNCVEVARIPALMVAVRNSRNTAAVLTFTVEAWRSFLDDVRGGHYDLDRYR
jgi:hypothetical protein